MHPENENNIDVTQNPASEPSMPEQQTFQGGAIMEDVPSATIPPETPEPYWDQPPVQQPPATSASTFAQQSGQTPPPPPPRSPYPQYEDVKRPEENAKKGVSAATVIIVAIIVAVVASLITAFALGVNPFAGNQNNQNANQAENETPSAIEISETPNQDTDKNLANVVAEKSVPSVVCIYTYTAQQSYEDMWDMFFFGQTPQGQQQQNQNRDSVDEKSQEVLSGLGSGVIMTSDGYILTNYHVVEGASSLKVKIGDEEYEGKVIGSDSSSDLAVVKVEADNLPAIEVSDSKNLRVGDWVMAIGAPYGYESTVTTGIVSALGRATAKQSMSGTAIYANLIQTDAAINSGNSGGALVDDEGKLVGINTLISSNSGGSDGLGFAIPSSYAVAVANQIISGKEVEHAQLGITLDKQTAENEKGGKIKSVNEGSAAADAGLKAGDVIVSIDGDKIDSPSEIVYIIAGHLVGDEVEVKYTRDGQELTTKIILKSEAKDQRRS